MENKKANILGTEYEIYVVTNRDSDPKLRDRDAYVDYTTKNIYIVDLIYEADTDPNSAYYTMKDLMYLSSKILRHEIVHAFYYESGLDCNTDVRCTDETNVDWLAIQFPKMLKVYKELGILEDLETL